MVTGFEIYNRLKVYPVCARSLDTHPLSGNKACFLHGDFIVIDRDGKVTVTFKLMHWLDEE